MADRKKRLKLTATPAVTGRQIELFGKKFIGKRVKLTNCRFNGLNELDKCYLEDAIECYDPVYLPEEPRGWICFSITDSKGNWLNWVYASLEKMGELVVAIEDGSIIHVRGVIAELYSPLHPEDDQPPSFFGLIVDQLLVEGNIDELQW